MEKHTGCKRGFTQLSKAWYGDANLKNSEMIDRFSIGFYHPEGGTTGEFLISYEELGGKIIPRLQAFDDGWDALFNFSDLIEAMSKIDDKNISPDDFNKLLVSLGIEDMTPVDDEFKTKIITVCPKCNHSIEK